MSKVIEKNVVLGHLFSMFSFCALQLPSCKHEAWEPHIQGVEKDWGQKILFQVSCGKGDHLNGNLSSEITFLATTLKNYIHQKYPPKYL